VDAGEDGRRVEAVGGEDEEQPRVVAAVERLARRGGAGRRGAAAAPAVAASASAERPAPAQRQRTARAGVDALGSMPR
jgi:hypothetical protein